jgi:hypothetical protein
MIAGHDEQVAGHLPGHSMEAGSCLSRTIPAGPAQRWNAPSAR